MNESYVEANDIRFHLVSNGPQQGKLVLLLHGFPEFSYSWRHQIPVLAEAGYRVWAPDLRGYNLSDKPAGVASYQILELARDVSEISRAATSERVILVGHDWGAAIAWRVAMEYPE